jgi:hypothetical protein
MHGDNSVKRTDKIYCFLKGESLIIISFSEVISLI